MLKTIAAVPITVAPDQCVTDRARSTIDAPAYEDGFMWDRIGLAKLANAPQYATDFDPYVNRTRICSLSRCAICGGVRHWR